MMSGATVPVWALGYAFAAVTAAAWWLTGRERGGLAVTAATLTAQAGLHCLFAAGQLVRAATSRAGTPSGSGGPGRLGGLSGGTGALGGRGSAGRPNGPDLLGGWGAPGGAGGSGVLGGPGGGVGGPGAPGSGHVAHVMGRMPAVPALHGRPAVPVMPAVREMHAMHTMPAMPAMPAMHEMHTWTLGMLAAHVVAALVCALWLWRGEAAVWRLGRALAALVTGPLSRARAVGGAAPLRTPRAGRAPAPAVLSPPSAVVLRYALVRRGPPYVLIPYG
jgi:hypothetical protein